MHEPLIPEIVAYYITFLILYDGYVSKMLMCHNGIGIEKNAIIRSLAGCMGAFFAVLLGLVLPNIVLLLVLLKIKFFLIMSFWAGMRTMLGIRQFMIYGLYPGRNE